MEPDTEVDMDLITLLGCVAPLLDACVFDSDRASRAQTLQTLRLVNSKSSRLAMLGARSLHLTLTGNDGEKYIGAARLAQHALLKDLLVILTLGK